MSATGCLLTEDQLLCCICLEVFTRPVTIPCGHNFCKICITENWKVSGSPCKCPLCKKQFATQPEMAINTFISGLADEFRERGRTKGPSGAQSQVAKKGDIACDVCTGTRLKALKSCLTCFASYCTVHLDPHQTSNRLKTHVLTEPVSNMEGRVCHTHKKPLELFCRRDQTFVCSHCTVSDHNGHNIVPLKDEYEVKRRGLVVQMEKMIQDRERKSQGIRLLKRHSQEDAEWEVASGVRVFTMAMQKAEKDLNQVIEKIEKRQRRMEEEADGYLGELEGEVSALRTMTTQLQHLKDTQDHLHELKNFGHIKPPSPTKNWSKIMVQVPTYEGMAVAAVVELEEMLGREKEQLLSMERLERIQQYAVEVVLDPSTAHSCLILSPDGKQVQCGEVMRDLPNNPKRFSLYTNVLAHQSFSSGRFYFEVGVTGKSDWTLGVATRSVNRKQIVPISPVHGYWAMCLRNGNEYLTLTQPVVSLALGSRLRRVGVFVSYEEGLVSFIDMDEALRLYCFTDCSFTEELHPFLNPGLYHGGTNTTPLTILQVIRREVLESPSGSCDT